MGLIDQMMANLYKPPKQEKTNTVLPKNLTPAKAANLVNQTLVSQGQLLKGQVLDLRANQILVLLENGATVSARTDGTLELSIGQNAKFFVAQTTEEQILLKLAKDDTAPENPMVDKALNAANIQKTERSVSIVTELLAHQQPVGESNIRHYLSLAAKYPELPVKDLILMELHHIPVTKENVEQFVNYQNRNAKLFTQAQNLLQELEHTIEHMPEGPAKQEVMQELKQILRGDNPVSTTMHGGVQNVEQNIEQTIVRTIEALPEQAVTNNGMSHAEQSDTAHQSGEPNADTPEQSADVTSKLSSDVPTIPTTTDTPPALADRAVRPDTEPLIKDFLNSFLLKPEDVADSEKVQNYYDELNEKLTKLEQVSQKLADTSTESNTANAPKEMRQNLSFMEAVNNVFPYIQLPLKFRETPTHGELYVYEKKKTLKPSDSVSALLHLELEALGTTDIFVTLAGNHVTTRFSMTDKASGDLIRTELPKLTEALATKGYTLQSEVTVREPEEETTPTLLEQFLEEHAPGGLNRYTFDIRA